MLYAQAWVLLSVFGSLSILSSLSMLGNRSLVWALVGLCLTMRTVSVQVTGVGERKEQSRIEHLCVQMPLTRRPW